MTNDYFFFSVSKHDMLTYFKYIMIRKIKTTTNGYMQ